MSQYKVLSVVFIYTVVHTMFMAGEGFQFEQEPSGDTLYLHKPLSRIVFRFLYNRTEFSNSFRLLVRLDQRTMPLEVYKSKYRPYTIVYTLCKSSDNPYLLCNETRMTLYGVDFNFSTIEFVTYENFTLQEVLATLNLQHQQNSVFTTSFPTSASPTSSEPGVESTASGIGSFLLQPEGISGYGVAGVLLVLLIITLIALMITCRYKHKSNEKKVMTNKEVND